MKDTLAGAVGTAGAGIVQIAENADILADPTSQETVVGGLISLVVGVVSMLLSRFLNKLAKKKETPKG